MKTVAYLRVSTDRQADQGLGLEVQEQAIRRWAKAQGHRVVAWCKDEGVSGSNGLDQRDGLADGLTMLRRNEASGLVVYRLDRLARDLVVQESLLAEIRRLGRELFTTSASEDAFLRDDPDDPSRKMIRQVLGAVSEYERGMIALRLRSGRRRKHDKGGFAFGSPPLGYKSVDGELRPDDDEQSVLSRIAEMRRGGFSIRAVADALGCEGYKTKRGGTTWHPTVVARLVARLEASRSAPDGRKGI